MDNRLLDTEKRVLSESVLQNILQFFEFIYDRQNIWHKRRVKKEDWPWTEDETLQKFRFCNVYRGLDKCTRYLDEKVLSKDGFTLSKKILNTVGFRVFNMHGFFEDTLGGYFDPYEFDFPLYEAKLDNAKKSGPIFNNAYIVTQQPYDTSYRKSDKHIQFLFVLQDIAQNREDFIERVFGAETPEDSWKEIKKTKLIGKFLAYELWTDFSYLNEFPFTDNDFAHAGPGAKWGLRLIFELEKSRSYGDWLDYLHENQEKWFNVLYGQTEKDWMSIATKGGTNDPYLSKRNIEHSLCEFRKYTRLKDGQGKRRLYNPKKN